MSDLYPEGWVTSRYVFTANGKLTIITTIENEAGVTVVTEEFDQVQVDTVDRAIAILQAAKSQGRSVSEEEAGVVSQILKDHFGEVDPELFDLAGSELTQVGKGDGPPDEPDTPEQQGASPVDTAGEFSRQRSEYEVNPDRPLDAIYARQNPTPPEIALEAAQPGASAEEGQDLIEKWLRGIPAPGQRSPFHSGEVGRLQVGAADPVEVFSGLLRFTKIDIEVPTPFLPLTLIRTYQSGLPYFGPWGFNWDHNYNIYLRELENGAIARWMGDLHEDFFRWTGDSFEPECGVHDRLESVPGLPHAYTLVRPLGTSLRFERPASWTEPERIPLVEIRDRHGNLQRLSYDSDNRLARVEDDDGRALIFRYGDCGLLERVEDHTGKRFVLYDHHSEIEHLVRVTTAPTANYPHGAVSCYDYDYLSDHPAMRHNLLRITGPDGTTCLENEYGGPETGWAFNRVTRQWLGDFSYQYGYEEIQFVPADAAFANVPAIRATVHSPDGALHSYTFNFRGDLLDYRFRLNLDGSFRIVSYQWEYDEQGNMTAEVHPDGGLTLYKYDFDNPNPCARGNLLRVELLAPPTFQAASRVVFEAIYDPVYQLPFQIRDEDKRLTKLTYDFDVSPGPNATGRLHRIDLPDATLPDSSIQTASYAVETNPRGQVTAVVTPEGTRHETSYVQTGPTAGLVDRVLLDAGVHPFESLHAYDETGQLHEITTPPGTKTGFVHNALGQVEEVVLPPVAGVSARVRALWTMSGNVVRLERPRGEFSDGVVAGESLVDEFELDALDNVLRAIIGSNAAKPRTTRYCADHEGHVVRVIDAAETQTRRCFDERGLLLRETLAAGTEDALSTKYAYDRVGRLIMMERPGGVRTSIDRDPWGRIAVIHLPGGSECHFKWGTRNLLSEIETHGDPGDGSPHRLLAKRALDYDERGRLKRETVWAFDENPEEPVELHTTYIRDKEGRVREVHQPRGGLVKYEYDGLDRPLFVEDVFGNRQHLVYDEAGNIRQITRTELEAGTERTTNQLFVHDERGRLRRVTSQLGQSVEFDYDDRDLLTERREPMGVSTRFRSGILGEIEQEVVDPDGLALSGEYEYDLLGRLLRYVDPSGETTSWTRDSLGRQVGIRLPDGSEWSRKFGPLGTIVAERTPSGSAFVYDYDSLSGSLWRLSCIPGPGVKPVPTHEFRYDGLDRLVRASIPGRQSSRRYDSLGRLVEEADNGKAVRLHYDDVAGVIDLSYPDGREERTLTDIGGRPQLVLVKAAGILGGTPGDLLAKISFGGVDRIVAMSYGNGVETALAYDLGSRLTRIEHTLGGNVLESCRIRYDARNRRRLTQLAGPPMDISLASFDTRDRLIDIRSSASVLPLGDVSTQEEHDTDIAAADQQTEVAERETYELDDADSRAKLTRVESSTTIVPYTYSLGHRVVQVASEQISHHADGTRSSDADRLYEVDALGRVVRVLDTVTHQPILGISYDALSRPVTMIMGGQTIHRWFVGDRAIHEESDANKVLRQATPHPYWPIPIAECSLGNMFFIHSDAMPSSTCLTNPSGIVVGRMRFGPFGAPSVFSSDGTTKLLPDALSVRPVFAGLSYLTAPKLYQSVWRLYDDRHGLFLSPDPALYRDSPSPYLYARHNPVDYVDPTGLWVESAWDMFSLSLGAVSFVHNVRNGNVGSAILDGTGILVDVVALAAPCIPGGIGVAIRAFRQGETVSEFTRVGGRVLEASEVLKYGQQLDRGVRSAQAVNSAVNVAQGGYNAYDQASQGSWGQAGWQAGIALLGARGLVTRGPVLTGHQTMGGAELVTRFRGSSWYRTPADIPGQLGTPMGRTDALTGYWLRFRHSWQSQNPPRPFESVTRNPFVARDFAGTGHALRFQVRRADLLPTPSIFHLFPVSGQNLYEAEQLVRGGTRIFSPEIVTDFSNLGRLERLEIWTTRLERGSIWATALGELFDGNSIPAASAAERLTKR